jgi:hypothetical protein
MAATRVKMLDVGEQRRRREGGRQRRRSFSVPRSGGEAQEAEEKGQVNPRPHIYTVGPGSWGSW